MLKQCLAVTALFVCIGAGCSKQEETPVIQNTTSENESYSATRTNESTRVAVNKRSENTEQNNRQRILTAEEQMRQYYAQQGLPEDEIEQKIDQPYLSKSRRELPDQSLTYKHIQASVNDIVKGDDNLISNAKNEAVQNQQVEESENHLTQTEQTKITSKTNQIEDISSADTYNETKPDYEPSQPDYSDAEAPELIAIRFDPQIAQPDQEVIVKVQAVDNLSGVKSVFGILKSPSNTAMVSFSCAIMQDDGTFQGSFVVPEHAEAGEWKVKNIRLTDVVHNSQNYTTKHPTVAVSGFSVESADADSIGPQLNAVYVDPVEASGGDRIAVMVDATDNKSGVARVYGVFASPSKNARLSFACAFDPELSVFYGSIDIPEEAESGTWVLDYLRLEDSAKNPTTYYYQSHAELLGKARLEIYSRNSDGQPPVLENVTIYPTTVVYGETVQITISASDDISGIQHISGTLQSESRQGKMPFHCRYIEEDQKYVAKIIIQEHTEVGLWHIENIILSDNARNQAPYNRYSNDKNVSALLEQASFEVIGQ